MGGHIIQAYVQPTLEVILIETPSHLRRTTDPKTGLALIDLRDGRGEYGAS
jgi:predicted DNA-binding protein with PD1-like motif